MSEETKGQLDETLIPEEQIPSEQSGQSVTSDDAVIPEKFAGKPVQEVVRAYQELESKLGSIASEKAQERQRAELLEQRLRDLETRSFQTPSQPVRQEQDPLSVLDSPVWEQDPREAIKKSISGVSAQLRQQQLQQQQYQQYVEMIDYYQRQKTENPDFVRREAIMQQLATQLAGVVKPEAFNSLPVLKALDLMSKGIDLGYYEQQAVERAKKEGLSRRVEKRNAHSESGGGSSRGSGKAPKDMSLDELEKLIASTSEQDE